MRVGTIKLWLIEAKKGLEKRRTKERKKVEQWYVGELALIYEEHKEVWFCAIGRCALGSLPF